MSDSLEHLVELTQEQLGAFNQGAVQLFNDLDRQVENAIGEKERRVGALREHEREHRCLTRTAGG